MTSTPPPWPTCTPGWCRIDPGLGAAATRVPAASREDSRPQAIFKFQPRNSFDYRFRYEPQLNCSSVNHLKFSKPFSDQNQNFSLFHGLYKGWEDKTATVCISLKLKTWKKGWKTSPQSIVLLVFWAKFKLQQCLFGENANCNKCQEIWYCIINKLCHTHSSEGSNCNFCFEKYCLKVSFSYQETCQRSFCGWDWTQIWK